jgi:hypothetical protein
VYEFVYSKLVYAIATTTTTTAVFSTTAFNWLLFVPAAIAVAVATMTAVIFPWRF